MNKTADDKLLEALEGEISAAEVGITDVVNEARAPARRPERKRRLARRGLRAAK